MSAAIVPIEHSSQLANLDRARALVLYDTARAALEKAYRVDEAKDIRDRAVALQAYARQAQDFEMSNWMAEIRLRAERKAGELLCVIPKQHGARGVGKKVESPTVTPLSELGITKRQSSKWQEMAAVSEDKFTTYVESAQKHGFDLSATGFLKSAQPHAEKRKNRNEPTEGFEKVRAVAIKMLNIGFREMQKTEANYSLLDSAKTWAQCKLSDRSESQAAA